MKQNLICSISPGNLWYHFHFSSVTQSCPTLSDPMDCSMPGFPVLHHFLVLAQTHVHWVGDAIQPSCPQLPPSSSAFYLSQHQVFSTELAFHIRCPKYWSFSFSMSPSDEYSNKISLGCKQIDLMILLVNLNLRLCHSVEAWKVKCSSKESCSTWKH